MKRALAKISALLLVVIFLSTACSTHVHMIGDGGQGVYKTEKRQWYALWGLVPINEVDTREMAGDAENYTITTQRSAVDIIVNLFTQYFTVISREVTVEK